MNECSDSGKSLGDDPDGLLEEPTIHDLSCQFLEEENEDRDTLIDPTWADAAEEHTIAEKMFDTVRPLGRRLRSAWPLGVILLIGLPLIYFMLHQYYG